MDFLRALSELRTPFWDVFMSAVTHLGEEIIIFGIIFIFYWCIDKNFAYKITFVFLISGIVVQSLKIAFRIDRPWVLDPNFHPADGVMKKATGYSFPSGHTQGATALFGTFFVSAEKIPLKIISILIIPLVAFSRLYLGVHRLSDVIFSLVFTAIAVFFVSFFFEKLMSVEKSMLIISAAALFVSAALCIFTAVLLAAGKVSYENSADTFKTAGAVLGFSVGYFLERKTLNFGVATKTKFGQILKLLCGGSVAVLILEGLKTILPSNAASEIIRYFLTVLWALYLFPLIFTKLKNINFGKVEERKKN